MEVLLVYYFLTCYFEKLLTCISCQQTFEIPGLKISPEFQSKKTPDLGKKNYLQELMLNFDSKSIVDKRKDCVVGFVENIPDEMLRDVLENLVDSENKFYPHFSLSINNIDSLWSEFDAGSVLQKRKCLLSFLLAEELPVFVETDTILTDRKDKRFSDVFGVMTELVKKCGFEKNGVKSLGGILKEACKKSSNSHFRKLGGNFNCYARSMFFHLFRKADLKEFISILENDDNSFEKVPDAKKRSCLLFCTTLLNVIEKFAYENKENGHWYLKDSFSGVMYCKVTPDVETNHE